MLLDLRLPAGRLPHRRRNYEVRIEDKWMVVPPKKILMRKDNPLGRGVVCYTPQQGIMCFVRTTET